MRGDTDDACMRTPKDQRQHAIIQLLFVVTCSALGLVAAGVEVSAVKDVLAIVFPPLIALAANAVGNENRRS